MENLLLKKLQIKAGYRVKVLNAPEHAAAIFGSIPENITFQFDADDSFDVLIGFSTSREALYQQIERHRSQIHSKTIFWVFYPKKSSKIPSDLDLMKSWKELEVYQLAPCASAAVNETWTALRLKLSSEIKPSGMRNDHIKTNDFGAYIDPVNKVVKLPDDLLDALQDHPQALAYLNQLAYSHRKEYVLWILSAKQVKTRINRIEKAIEMLLSDKKNPSAK